MAYLEFEGTFHQTNQVKPQWDFKVVVTEELIKHSTKLVMPFELK